MEWKIGEIRQVNGEWYQSVKSDNTCNGCVGKFQPYSFCNSFKDCVGKIFKKLEKVGEPYNFQKKTFQTYKLHTIPFLSEDVELVAIPSKDNNTIEIEIKQNKEDMEENKLNLKPFDIQKAKEGKPVCTRDGRKTRIICFDANIMPGNKNILALIRKDDGSEYVEYYTSNGKFSDSKDDINDLMMLPEKKEGWVNIYRDQVYNAFEKAEEARKIAEHGGDNCLKTIKINWEE